MIDDHVGSLVGLGLKAGMTGYDCSFRPCTYNWHKYDNIAHIYYHHCLNQKVLRSLRVFWGLYAAGND